MKNNKSKKLFDKVKVLKTNEVYRVSDLVYKAGMRYKKDIQTILNDSQYKDTVLYDYFSQGKLSINAFTAIINRHQNKYERPNSDSLVIHLRLGDVMDEKNKTDHYIQSKKNYASLNLKGVNHLSKATIVTALHFGANDLTGDYYFSKIAYQNSLEVFDIVCNQLQQQGFEVDVKSSENVDEDMCYLAGSSYLIKGMSKFSNLLAKATQSGTIIYDYSGKHPYIRGRFSESIEHTRILSKKIMKKSQQFTR